ncbi:MULTISPECIES: glutamine--fructose-6-phosphate transaminase (isomerizing) [Clostridium]|jgi:glucosamine--fructose-6-phosphate aminotransferase (isomerizing)|uniref:glutamine--fructose-6-phosphate transaminase (isomerizing) n=1 Tax=Clostridium TaxID=1485 RepID=UPI000DD03010|nr:MULTISPECIES: glutamine--fructose-6-phosphate transaminase (isomerizing) [Clostridium]MBS6502748.1 glutamine--fructose-6-phosphate transaminase (isomerizing) [Clostridium sp.]MBU6134010.1 glutamine--fructose-6-phosphate transaminase (isomerizing) [Clostridium tertium]MDB1939694.1 glutamine--fructose-6-phosphate transaminase (isomerizing) [Clostridium tertium]MDB1946318.1 glutamine--fructose-6-phosphate transaminase (isomerizing) [Clostridium tertium]MDU3409032.1 glutamine--fructose-6-phosph
MCGIVGFVGKKEASPILVEGLSKLEYRGYDSAGVAVLEDGEIKVRKFKGRLKNLADDLEQSPLKGSMGIGHTRWATHGEPSDINSHPHTNENATISVVHNGIIENYIKLREWLKGKGYEFYSETDTEVIPNLVDYYYKGDLFEAVVKATSKMEGSYAIGVICKDEPDKIVAVRKDSPLIVGVGKEEYFIASDIPAVINHTREVYLLEDKEFVIMTRDGIEIKTEDGEVVDKDIYHVTWDVDAAEKGGYEDFMLKEIHEQPKAIKDTLTSRVIKNTKIQLDDIDFTKEELEAFDRVFIVACGTAYHAGLVGKTIIEKLAKIPVEVDIASEFRYRDPLITENSLLIVVSQSGETADTLAVLRDAKRIGARVLAITNVVGSSVSREAHHVVYTWAGPEIAVASTKAYETQLIAMYILGIYFGEIKGTINNELSEALKEELMNLSEKVKEILTQKEKLQKYASKNYMDKDVFFLGRGLDYAVALEGSLKLKEISYIHSEAYAGGELKHGTIALIEDGTPIIALLTDEKLKDKMISNIREVVTRGAKILGIANEGDKEAKEVCDDVIYIPKTNALLTPVLSVVPLQLLAYYMAKQKGCDVDKPRNLAKSVTVE